MIASLTGNIQSKLPNSLVLDVSGVGYQVFISNQVLESANVGDRIFLHTSFIVREDAFLLFGFAEAEQLSLFELLRSVSGVGPKTALAIISSLSGADIAYAVAHEDPKAFEKVSGVGVKTAKLIVVTLTGKLKSVTGARSSSANDLLEALQGLGWPERVAEPAVREVLAANTDSDLSTLIRQALVILGGK